MKSVKISELLRWVSHTSFFSCVASI